MDGRSPLQSPLPLPEKDVAPATGISNGSPFASSQSLGGGTLVATGSPRPATLPEPPITALGTLPSPAVSTEDLRSNAAATVNGLRSTSEHDASEHYTSPIVASSPQLQREQLPRGRHHQLSATAAAAPVSFASSSSGLSAALDHLQDDDIEFPEPPPAMPTPAGLGSFASNMGSDMPILTPVVEATPVSDTPIVDALIADDIPGVAVDVAVAVAAEEEAVHSATFEALEDLEDPALPATPAFIALDPARLGLTAGSSDGKTARAPSVISAAPSASLDDLVSQLFSSARAANIKTDDPSVMAASEDEHDRSLTPLTMSAGPFKFAAFAHPLSGGTSPMVDVHQYLPMLPQLTPAPRIPTLPALPGTVAAQAAADETTGTWVTSHDAVSNTTTHVITRSASQRQLPRRNGSASSRTDSTAMLVVTTRTTSNPSGDAATGPPPTRSLPAAQTMSSPLVGASASAAATADASTSGKPYVSAPLSAPVTRALDAIERRVDARVSAVERENAVLRAQVTQMAESAAETARVHHALMQDLYSRIGVLSATSTPVSSRPVSSAAAANHPPTGAATTDPAATHSRRLSSGSTLSRFRMFGSGSAQQQRASMRPRANSVASASSVSAAAAAAAAAASPSNSPEVMVRPRSGSFSSALMSGRGVLAGSGSGSNVEAEKKDAASAKKRKSKFRWF
ncbi:hypothetical protein BC828DRAFT_398638 [Blastocladiella britannica]|nr:hypothetical protein BC828DRAFT_398638 [Blastocladiella britannica]